MWKILLATDFLQQSWDGNYIDYNGIIGILERRHAIINFNWEIYITVLVMCMFFFYFA